MRDFTADISKYLEKLKGVIDKLDIGEINRFINLLCEAREKGKQIFIMGNGGSAATASHFCNDFNKGASYEFKSQKRFKFICLNDNVSTLMAYANDVSYSDVFVEQLKNFYIPGDMVIGISGSGNSENVIKALEYANANGGITAALTGYDGGKLKKIAGCSLHINVDDMQITEDLHMMMDHLSMKVIANMSAER
jgi:D-sedoheptulose 7-phosphate isomerase